MYFACGNSGEIMENKVLQVLAFHWVNYVLCGFFFSKIMGKQAYLCLFFLKKHIPGPGLLDFLVLMLLFYPQTHVAFNSFIPIFLSVHCIQMSSPNDRPTMPPLSPSVHVCSWVSELPLPRPPRNKKSSHRYMKPRLLAPIRAGVVSFWIRWPDLKDLQWIEVSNSELCCIIILRS